MALLDASLRALRWRLERALFETAVPGISLRALPPRSRDLAGGTS
jgi:hypothetical protein